jgi:hypothetical protein
MDTSRVSSFNVVIIILLSTHSSEQIHLQIMGSTLHLTAPCVFASNEVLSNPTSVSRKAPKVISCVWLHPQCILPHCEVQFQWIYQFGRQIVLLQTILFKYAIPNLPSTDLSIIFSKNDSRQIGWCALASVWLVFPASVQTSLLPVSRP